VQLDEINRRHRRLTFVSRARPELKIAEAAGVENAHESTGKPVVKRNPFQVETDLEHQIHVGRIDAGPRIEQRALAC
jgi:hypothetical protein